MRNSSARGRIGRAVAIASLALAVGAADAAGAGQAAAAEPRALSVQELDRVTAGREAMGRRGAFGQVVRGIPFAGDISRLFERLLDTDTRRPEQRGVFNGGPISLSGTDLGSSRFNGLSSTGLGSGRFQSLIRNLSSTGLGSGR